MVIGWQDRRLSLGAPPLQEPRDLGLHVLELPLQCRHVVEVEIGLGLLAFVLEEHIAIGHGKRAIGIVEGQLVEAVDTLQVHGQALQSVGQLASDRKDVKAPYLLEVGVLGHLHPVAPDLPAQAPGADSRVFPVVLDETDVV